MCSLVYVFVYLCVSVCRAIGKTKCHACSWLFKCVSVFVHLFLCAFVYVSVFAFAFLCVCMCLCLLVSMCRAIGKTKCQACPVHKQTAGFETDGLCGNGHHQQGVSRGPVSNRKYKQKRQIHLDHTGEILKECEAMTHGGINILWSC